MKQLVRRTLNRFGYDVIRVRKSPQTSHEEGLRPLFSALALGGFTPHEIVDIGANRGMWTRVAMKFFPAAHYTMVEPQAKLREYSQDLIDGKGNVTWLTAGAADVKGTLPLYVAHRDDSTSFLEARRTPNCGDDPIVGVEVTTLNEIAAKYCATPPEIVKIDAEGFDLKVLAGASDLMGKTDVFLVEAVVFATGQENTLDEVIRRMTAAGYRAVEITEVNRSPKYGITWLCELAFLRNGCHWLDRVASYE